MTEAFIKADWFVPRRVTAIFPVKHHIGDLFLISHPKTGVVAISRNDVGDGGTEITATDECHFHRVMLIA